MITWAHKSLYKLFVFGRNSWNHITVFENIYEATA